MNALEECIIKSPLLMPTTKTGYLGSVRAFIAFAGDSPRGWTPLVVENFRDSLVERGLKPETINLYIDSLRFASKRWALTNNNPALNFAALAEKLRRSAIRKTRRALSLQEARAVLMACRGDGRPIDVRDTAIATLAFRTGLRRAGMAGIQFSDIKNDRVTVTLKGGRRYELPPWDRYVAEAMNRWMGWLRAHGHRSGPVFRRLWREPLSGPPIVGEFLSSNGVASAMQLRFADAGVKMVLHETRHTFITWMREAKPLKYDALTWDRIIMTYTGHSVEGHWRATIDVYTDVLELCAREMFTELLPRL